MHICHFAFIGSENLGDEAIFETIHRDLQQLKPESITVLSMNVERTRRLVSSANTEVLRAQSLRDTVRAIRRCDLFVCGGGGIFQDQTSIYNPARYLSRIQLSSTV
jgi:polysaccharide pyruvyl transferase WcaK-like protein